MKYPSNAFPMVAFAIASMAPAMAAPNLSGEWKLNATKSNYGSVPKPEVMIRKIRQAGPSLVISTYQKGQQGELTTDLKYTTDGKPSVNKGKGGETTGTATWHGDRLLIESAREFQGAQLKSIELWTLSPDGKVLTVATRVILPQGDLTVTMVFDKQ